MKARSGERRKEELGEKMREGGKAKEGGVGGGKREEENEGRKMKKR